MGIGMGRRGRTNQQLTIKHTQIDNTLHKPIQYTTIQHILNQCIKTAEWGEGERKGRHDSPRFGRDVHIALALATVIYVCMYIYVCMHIYVYMYT